MSNLCVTAVRVSGRRRRSGLPDSARNLATSASSSLMRVSSADGVGADDLVAAFVGLFGVQRLRTLRAVAINGHAFQAHLPRLHVSVADFLDGAFLRHVDGLGNRAADERLRGGHHLQVRQIMDAALAADAV